MQSKIIFETERLLLQEFTIGNARFILKLLNTPAWLKNIGDKNIHSVKEAQNYLENTIIKSYKENGFGMWLILLKESKIPIGMCGLVNRETLDDIDIGFALLPDYTNLGYGYESANATFTYTREVLGIEKIVAITASHNIPSIKLLEKLGLQFEKTINLTKNDNVLLFSPSIKGKDIAEINVLTNRFFSLFTNKKGEKPNLKEIKNLFISRGIIINNSRDITEIYDLDEFIKPREQILTNGTLKNFSEKEISHQTKIFANIAHRFCLYEKSGELNGKKFETKGMKTIQFIKESQKWNISSVAWCDEK
jgi:RimJ/RimL family protein N-acetyltransferase